MTDTSSAATPAAKDSTSDFLFAIRLTCATAFITLLITWRPYVISDRLYLMAPLIPSLAHLPPLVMQAVYAGALALLAWLFLEPQRKAPAFGFILCELFWVLQDVNRAQPYQYMFTYVILIGALTQHRKNEGVDAVKLMICGVYFWAGAHKANATFYDKIFPWFVSPLYDFHHPSHIAFIRYASYAVLFSVPFFEAAIGILLLFPRGRAIASIMAGAMLAMVLLCLGPLGRLWGMSVWPWNIYLFWLEYRLFYNTAARESRTMLTPHPYNILSIVLFVLAPMLAIWTPWYTYPGFKLYAGNTENAFVHFPPEETLSKAPRYVRSAVTPEHTLDEYGFWRWYDVYHRYPVPYAFRTGAAGLCPYLDFPDKARLEVVYPAPFYNTKTTSEFSPLCPKHQ